MEKYCSRCKTTEGDFVIQSRSRNGNKTYYHCLPCNTARMRKYYENGGNLKVYKANLNFASKNKEKVSAWRKVLSALKRGLIKKPGECSACGVEKRSKLIQGHHRDYSKPLEVLWLCAKCHKQEHKTMLQLG